MPNQVEIVQEALRQVVDPELHLNIVDLGLIYDISEPEPGNIHITMTLTTPGCPVGSAIVRAVEYTARSVPGVDEVQVTLTFEPRWTTDRITEAGRRQLHAF